MIAHAAVPEEYDIALIRVALGDATARSRRWIGSGRDAIRTSY